MRTLRMMTTLIVVLLLLPISDSSLQPVPGHDQRERYGLLVEERDRLLKRNRLLSTELPLALSSTFYLIVHAQPPAIVLKAQGTPLREYGVCGLYIDRGLRRQVNAHGVLQLSLENIREISSSTWVDLKGRGRSFPDDKGRSTSAMDSLSSQPSTLYALELDQHITMYVHSLVKKEDPLARMRSLLKNVGERFMDTGRKLFFHKKTIRVVIDDQDMLSLCGSLQVGMEVLLAE